MKRPASVLAEGIGQPAGPCALPDGRIVFTDTYRSALVSWRPDDGLRSYAYTGGAPNACALGSDGRVYVANCPTAWSWVAPDKRPACIQRVRANGQVEIFATHADGVAFDGPNDLCFGPDGRLYFTDSGDWAPEIRPHRGRICVLDHDGAGHLLEELDHTYPNGIAAEEDGSIVWVESYTRRMIRRRPDGGKTVIHTFAPEHIPDGFKIDIDGNFWVATVTSCGIDIVSPEGAAIDFLELDAVPLNCLFVGDSLYVADFSHFETTGEIQFVGRLLRVDVGVHGMATFSGAIR